MERKMNENQKRIPMFSVCVITYNQENFISQTLESILSQKHDFSWELLVGDDCSSDGTRKIIQEYAEKFPEIVRPIFNEKNLGLVKNFFSVMKNARGKYIMECAGDDWWLPGKAKTQIDFMENHPEIGMCYGKCFTYKDGKKLDEKKAGWIVKKTFAEFIQGNSVPALTVCYRKELFDSYVAEINPEEKNWLMEDYPMWLYFSKNSRLEFLNEYFACYRALEGSASHQTDFDKAFLFAKSFYAIRKFFAEKYNFSCESFSDEKIKFGIYLGKLDESYDKNSAKSMAAEFKKMPDKTFKRKIFFYASKNFFFWKIFKLARKIHSLRKIK
jgi:glycosyltransferase involved in cell wall biosynthesis